MTKHEGLACTQCWNREGTVNRVEYDYGAVWRSVQEFNCPICGRKEISEVTSIRGSKLEDNE